MRYVVNTDGGTRKSNPGKAAIGYVIVKDGNKGKKNVLSQRYQLIGWATNNEAEYIAVIYALERLLLMGARHVTVRCDNQMVVESIKQGWTMSKSPHLARLKERVEDLMVCFDEFSIKWVPRKENDVADGLCRIAFRERWPE